MAKIMEFKTLNKKQLSDFIDSVEYSKMDNLPISRHRAISQMANPRLDDNDVLLILCFEEDQLCGYLGTLPDFLYYEDHFEKCAWMSCIWINPTFRGKNIAFKLVEKGLELWDNRLLATRFTDPAKKLYDKTGRFNYLCQKQGRRYYLRSDLHFILAPKHPLFNKLKGILKLKDLFFNFFLDWRYWLIKDSIEGYQFEYIEKVNEELNEFIRENQNKELFKRSSRDFNWILNNPWILSAKVKDKMHKKYYFSSVDKKFEIKALKIRNVKGQLCAFIIFTLRNTHLKIPYFYQNTDCRSEPIRNIILLHIKKWKVSTLSTYNSSVIEILGNLGLLSLYQKKITNRYIIAKAFETNKIQADIHIQDGDGDSVFT
ncbi:GNAT family N-acetyltransferase [Hyphobacterium sp. CCMP332]|nr:GNAT family N-acetyltransferase [Hyphobacterium sp. CCMP332]